MTDTILSSGNESIKQAGLEGIGDKWAARLEVAGIATVRDLAEADIDRLAKKLSKHTTWKTETLHQHVLEWIGLAKERLRTTSTQLRGHVFMLKLWVDAEGRSVRSRFAYHNPDEPKIEKASHETVGWSPLAFARFVDRAAGVVEAKELTVERVDAVELVEWSKHRVEGQLIRGGRGVAVVTAIPSEDLYTKGNPTLWRASGQLIPFGGGATIDLGTCAGRVEPGEAVNVVFGPRQVPNGLYRAWFDLAVSPPVTVDHVISAADLAASAVGRAM